MLMSSECQSTSGVLNFINLHFSNLDNLKIENKDYHAEKHTKLQLCNKIKNPGICWRNSFQLILPLRQWGAVSSYCSCLWNCIFVSTSPEAWNHVDLGKLQLQHWQPHFKGEILWNGPIWEVSASSWMAGSQHSELFRGRRSPAPGSPWRLHPSAESIPSVCGSTAPLLLFPFFPDTKPSSWGSAGTPIWMEEALKGCNKYYNLFAVGITFFVLSRGNRKGSDFDFV